MTRVLALHTAARRYCEERAAFFHHAVLDAIQAEVEGLRPETLASEREVRDLLILAGRVAGDAYTAPLDGSPEGREVQQERDLFCIYVENLEGDALARVAPMAARRTLLSRESKDIWAGMRRRWGVNSATRHRPHGPAPPGALVFDSDAFEEHVPVPVFQDILSEHGIGRAFELREWGPEYELEVSLLVPSYNVAQMPSCSSAQGYWTAGEMDWLVHASDQASVTVAGDWLVRAVEQQWPTWSEHPVRY